MVLYFIDFLRENYPDSFKERYGIDLKEELDNVKILDDIARDKNFLRNKYSDYERVYEMIINDFRSLKLGNITIERPNYEE